MSVYPFCAQCKRKTPEKTAIFNSYCDCCNETLCIECSNNHTSVKGFSSHKLIDSAILLSPSAETICHCNVHSNKILIWYCLSYDVYLCDECERTATCDRSTCNRHICFNENPHHMALAEIQSCFQGEMSKMENILDICYKSRITNEKELKNQLSSAEFRGDNDEVDYLEHFRLERSGIEKLQHYLETCREELNLIFRFTSRKMLSLLMKISKLKQDILKLYLSLTKISVVVEDRMGDVRLKKNLTSVCETGILIIKSFKIECKVCLQEEEVIKVIPIDNGVVVITPTKIQRYNCRNKLEQVESNMFFPLGFKTAYIREYRLVAILENEYDYVFIQFLNIDTFSVDEKHLKFPKQNVLQYMSAVAVGMPYIYFAGQNVAGRISFNNQFEYFIYNGHVGKDMVIKNDEIFIPYDQNIRIFSLKFELLRVLSLTGETPVQGPGIMPNHQQLCPSINQTQTFYYQAPQPYQQVGNHKAIQWYAHQPHSVTNLQQPMNIANFTSITTDQGNNVYAVNTNSHDIIRWDNHSKQWNSILTACHGLRNPSSLCFDEEYSKAFVCINDFNSTKKCLLKYNISWDINRL